jgi:glutamate-1-semialdehyde 2,1-aminomutase
MTDLETAFRERFPISAALHQRARKVLPGGLTHDVRRFDPFPIYVSRAEGPYKWTEEGHRLIDYGMGHGALLLGHDDPEVRAAADRALHMGTHFSAPHRSEIEWAELVTRLVPSADVARFTASGTEAILLATRLARAFTGRPKMLKLEGHFHGWHDEATIGSKTPFDQPASAGLGPGVTAGIRVVPTGDEPALEAALRTGEFAALILEPTGASWGTVPLPTGYLAACRRLTASTETLLIFDEVISGFRLSPGGAQQHFGITPDLTCLAKILAGGLPGGAVAGRRDVMAMLEFRGADDWDRNRRVSQQGTFNANPVSAAAGVAALTKLADGKAQEQASRLGERLRRGLNRTMADLDVPGCAYGISSFFHLWVGKGCPIFVDDDQVGGEVDTATLMTGMPNLMQLRQSLILEGIDLLRHGGFVSAVHSEADVDETIEAFTRALGRERHTFQ